MPTIEVWTAVWDECRRASYAHWGTGLDRKEARRFEHTRQQDRQRRPSLTSGVWDAAPACAAGRQMGVSSDYAYRRPTAPPHARRTSAMGAGNRISSNRRRHRHDGRVRHARWDRRGTAHGDGDAGRHDRDGRRAAAGERPGASGAASAAECRASATVSRAAWGSPRVDRPGDHAAAGCCSGSGWGARPTGDLKRRAIGRASENATRGVPGSAAAPPLAVG